MSNLKRIIPSGLSILLAVMVVACGTGSPTAPTMPPVPTNTPLPTVTPAPTNTPLPTATLWLEVPQRPELPAPDLEGAVEVPGYTLKLNYQCYGEGSPTIIVEAGGGDKPIGTANWNAVIQGVQSTARICIYDRLPVSTVQAGAENLHLLLTTASIPGPYIIVAHSLGGWYARVFTHLYPDEVAGLILVDTTPTHPEGAIVYATAYPTSSPGESASIAAGRLSEDYLGTFPATLPSFEGLDMEASNAQVRAAGSFGDLPLTVIGHTPGPLDLAQTDPAIQDQFADVLIQIESFQASLSSRGVFIQAATTNHFISVFQPQIVIDAILQMVGEIKNK